MRFERLDVYLSSCRSIAKKAERVSNNELVHFREAFYCAAVTGLRSGIPGRPYEAELRLKSHADNMLKTAGKVSLLIRP
jgi:hypothetical protein